MTDQDQLKAYGFLMDSQGDMMCHGQPVEEDPEEEEPPQKRARGEGLLVPRPKMTIVDAEKTARLVLQPMLTMTLLQCRECSDESRRRVAAPVVGGKIALTVIMCDRCLDANRRIRSINNCDILPYSKQNYKK